MEEMHDKRIKREFAVLVNRRKRSALIVLRTFKNAQLPETEVMPQGPDFCHFSAVSEVLNRTADVDVDVSSFNDIISLLPELVMEWRESIKRRMIQVIKMYRPSRELNYLDFDLDFMLDICGYMDDEPLIGPKSQLTDEELSQKLTLASTVFTCNCNDGCNNYPGFYDSDDEDESTSKILFYPQVMGHNCLSRVSKMYSWEFSATDDPSCLLESYRSERKQWDSSSLSLHRTAGATARHIIQLAGLDPDLATSHQMDQLKIRFACNACPSRVSPESEEEEEEEEDDDDDNHAFPVFGWRGAVSRCYYYYCIIHHLCLSYRLVIIVTDIHFSPSTRP